jgi:hypothetical protein
MMIAFTYLPGFVIMIFRGMPTVWRGRHRLLLCGLVFMHAVSPGCKTLAEMARWTPAAITAWRFGRLLKAAYWHVHLPVRWLARDILTALPPPPIVCCLCLATAATPTNATPSIPWRRKGASASLMPGCWPALRAGDGGVGRVSRAGGFSAHCAQAPCRLSPRKCPVVVFQMWI